MGLNRAYSRANLITLKPTSQIPKPIFLSELFRTKNAHKAYISNWAANYNQFPDYLNGQNLTISLTIHITRSFKFTKGFLSIQIVNHFIRSVQHRTCKKFLLTLHLSLFGLLPQKIHLAFESTIPSEKKKQIKKINSHLQHFPRIQIQV